VLANDDFELRDFRNYFGGDRPGLMVSDWWPEEPYAYDCGPADGYRIPDRAFNGAFGSLTDAWFQLNKAVQFFREVTGASPIPEAGPITVFARYWYGGSSAYVAPTSAFRMPKNSLMLSDGNAYADSVSADRFSQVVPDIVAHELAHAFTHTRSGVRGPWAEALADFVGELFEEWLTGSSDWQHGILACRHTDPIVAADRCGVRSFSAPVYSSLTEVESSGIRNTEKPKAEVLDHAFYRMFSETSLSPRDVFAIALHAETTSWRTRDYTDPEQREDDAFFARTLLDAARALNHSDETVAALERILRDVGALSEADEASSRLP
jgi:hypothetical protein